MSVFRAQIKPDGGLSLGSEFNSARFKEVCKENIGKWLRIELEMPLRSMSQHRYYWVYMGVLSSETGHTQEELHSWAKKKFLSKKFATVFGEDVELHPSTRSLNKAEFGEYLERICAETGVPLPDPQAEGYISNH
jgi:hypothetical protein